MTTRALCPDCELLISSPRHTPEVCARVAWVIDNVEAKRPKKPNSTPKFRDCHDMNGD